MMISKRNFVIMTLMMLVLLVMFMVTRTVQDNKDDYSKNSYYEQQIVSINSAENGEELLENEEWSSLRRSIVYIGNTEEEAYGTVRDFCDYTKCDVITYDSFDELDITKASSMELVVAGPESISKTGKELKDIMEKGIPILIYEMPSVQELDGNKAYQELFGIQKIVAEETSLDGIKLFSNFLLGGEVIYPVDDQKEGLYIKESPSMPWYQVAGGTKVFMVGLMEDETVKNEELPPIIWRTYHDNSFLYAVNGAYFKTETGLGILSGVIADEKPFYIYPVVNAQNLSLLDFPGLANENTETLENIYARSQTTLCRDVLLPSIIAFLRVNDFKATSYMMFQANYQDDILPKESELDLYFQQFYQNQVEIGLSVDAYSDVSLADKFAEDEVFYKERFFPYRVGAIYGKNSDEVTLSETLGTHIYTIVEDADPTKKIVSASGNRVIQQITSDASDYDYQSDLTMRSIETVLGYSNIKMDFYKILWPAEEDMHWEKMSDLTFRVAGTYWKSFYGYDQTTISESDQRVRNYLNLNYVCKYGKNALKLSIAGSEEGYFMLRTHGQEIAAISGGEYTQFEKDAYLIHVESSDVYIMLKDAGRDGLLSN